jgi:hypothetical protein
MSAVNSQEQLWEQISAIVTSANSDMIKRNEKMDELARLSKLYLYRQRNIDTVDPKRFKPNKELLKPTMRRKIVLHYSEKPDETGDWIARLLTGNRRRVMYPSLMDENCELDNYLLAEYLLHELSSLAEVTQLFNRYGDYFKNCEVFLLIVDTVPDTYLKYYRSVVRDASCLMDMRN